MEITLGNSSLCLTILGVGLTAGICFTWGNAVTPGIGQLSDIYYLEAFQKMNRSIENPLFFMVFFGSFLLGIAALLTNKSLEPVQYKLLMLGMAIYFVGIVLVTIFGNVPLNQVLEKTDLAASTAEELKTLRRQFETPWNRFHLLRVLASIVSFALLTIVGILK
ncbi:hypothetical protein GCM10011414_00300 [Croceivirga lutea]|uniref:anthrone oxygenase family protein n=1 Tax=Croceivirga lutea TaxID=1775167 RepID=UPI00163A6003|nr:DUF1772 domain-containing protein [Croceivirga lutea]GGG34813.1 hypothetical protein GCM10011414_00300 [Croceivirga lutea]